MAEVQRSYAIIDPATGTLPIELVPPEVLGGEGPSQHPDLAEHEALGLASAHAHDFAPTNHGHVHDHDGSYASPHAHPYAPTSHAHLDADIPSGIARDAEVSATYALIHSHPYEASGAVATHAATPHGGGTWTTVLKTADESKNSLAVVADDALLKFTTLPNTNYTIRLRAWFLTNATADLKYRLFHTGTTTRVRRKIVRTATADVPAHITTGLAFDVADVILSTTGLNPFLEEDVILQVGASGGLFVLRWSQVTSNAGPTTCLEGSYLEYAIT